MADVNRAEFDALSKRVATLEGGRTPTPPVVVVPPQKGVVLSTPSVVVEGTTYTLNASLVSDAALKLTYLQIAVRGEGARDLALTPAVMLKAGQNTNLTGVGHGTGDFSAYLAYSKDGTTWVDGPKVAFSIPRPVVPADVPVKPVPQPQPSPGGRRIPLVGKSGLKFNSIVFRQETAQAEQFGARRGTPMDGLLMFKGRQSWNDFRWVPAGHRDWLEQGRLIVTSMPHAPESEGSAMNAKGANDAYRNEQRDLGKWLADNGFNQPTHVIRIDWECNGDWYAWSANHGGPEALKAAIRNYVVNLRAGGATKVKFDLCFNKGPSQSGADFAIFPGNEFIDVVAIDSYDMWAPSYSQSDWEREMAKTPSIRSAADFAKVHDIMWSWDEGGNTHGNDGGAYGGDNPTYWQLVRAEIDRNIERCAWHNTYDDKGAPATLAHDFDQNPKSWPVYRKLWTPA